MLIIHMGIVGWQYYFTDVGLTPEVKVTYACNLYTNQIVILTQYIPFQHNTAFSNSLNKIRTNIYFHYLIRIRLFELYSAPTLSSFQLCLWFRLFSVDLNLLLKVLMLKRWVNVKSSCSNWEYQISYPELKLPFYYDPIFPCLSIFFRSSDKS